MSNQVHFSSRRLWWHYVISGWLEASQWISSSASLDLLFGPWLRQAGHCDIFSFFGASRQLRPAGGLLEEWLAAHIITRASQTSAKHRLEGMSSSDITAGRRGGRGCRALVCRLSAPQKSGGGMRGTDNAEGVEQWGGGVSRHVWCTRPLELLIFRTFQGMKVSFVTRVHNAVSN